MANLPIAGQLSYNLSPGKHLDYYYGPYQSLDDAKSTTATTIDEMGDEVVIRYIGLTVGVITATGVVEYWFKNGITDADLVVKSSDIELTTEISPDNEQAVKANAIYEFVTNQVTTLEEQIDTKVNDAIDAKVTQLLNTL